MFRAPALTAYILSYRMPCLVPTYSVQINPSSKTPCPYEVLTLNTSIVIFQNYCNDHSDRILGNVEMEYHHSLLEDIPKEYLLLIYHPRKMIYITITQTNTSTFHLKKSNKA